MRVLDNNREYLLINDAWNDQDGWQIEMSALDRKRLFSIYIILVGCYKAWEKSIVRFIFNQRLF